MLSFYSKKYGYYALIFLGKGFFAFQILLWMWGGGGYGWCANQGPSF